MKLVVSIVHRDDADALLKVLVTGGFRATKISTMGGFLRRGNATILIGAEDQEVPQITAAIRATCRTRSETYTPVPPDAEPWEMIDSHPLQVEIGGATVFVLSVDQFYRY